MSDYNKDEFETNLVETLKEQIWDSLAIKNHLNQVIKSYNLDFDIDGPMTDTQEDLVCQYQGQIVHRILGKLITSI